MTTQGRLSTFEDRAHEVMDALVTAAALVAVADGSVHAVEREELVNCIDEESLFPGSLGLKSRQRSTKERSNSNSEMGLRSSLKPCGRSQAYSRPS
jgi:tellurite resistance protein